jgi:SAM-dependent methyltransferase
MTREMPTLEQWCADVPGLTRTGVDTWESSARSSTALTGEAHALLAEIEPQSFWFKHRNEVIAAVVRRFPPNGPIFDIGGGNGYVSAGLREAGFTCVVLEPGQVGAANAARRGFPVIRAAFQDLRIADGTIPSAGMFDVLEHIGDDTGALANMHRVLAPGGRLYIAVPAYRLLWSDDDVSAGHFRRYTLHVLAKKLQEAGFAVDYSTYFFAVLVLPILFMRVLTPFLRPKSKSKMQQDHTLPTGMIGAVFRRSFARELAKIVSGGRRNIGASCLLVARKL